MAQNDTINGYYQKYLGRAASADETNGWLNGSYGWGDSNNLAGIESGISSSGEAKAYASKSTPDATDVNGTVAKWMASNNPQNHQDANYWVGRINDTGGLNAGNVGYWQGRFTEAPGTHVEGPAGGAAPSYGAPQAAAAPQGDSGMAALTQFLQQQQQASAAQKAADQAKSDSLYQTLMDRSQQSLQVNPNDANIRQQADPYAAQVERSKRNYLADLAEKSGPLANLQGETRVASEHAGQAVGGFESQLIGNELSARRGEVQNALAQMGGMMSDSQRNGLQAQLSQMDAAIRTQQMAQQGSQFGQSLGLDYAKLAQDQNQFGSQMGFNYANLAQNQNQFKDQQSFNYANMDETTRRLLLQLLGTNG